MAAEEITHKVMSVDGDIEIRHYEEAVKAVVTVEGARRAAPNKAFRILFDFISGNNMAQQEIAMTTPVAQQEISQKIPMTTPVSQEQIDEGQWKIAFYMPNDMTYETTPKPKDARVTIEPVPSRIMAAIKFSGFASDDNIQEHEQELVQYLKANQIEYINEPTYAFYNAPWIPWFMRRNEVLFELKETPQAATGS